MTTATPHKRHWFKAKKYGWGWTPTSWQGWVVMLMFFGVTIGNFYRTDMTQYSDRDTVVTFVLQTIICVIILLAICYKTGERPRWRWRWGDDDTPQPN